MREIKFRGKRLDTDIEEWLYGDLTHGVEYTDEGIIPAFRVGVRLNPVVPGTVGQFTGIRDVDGKEIYEGDILVFGNPDSEWDFDRCHFEIAYDNPPYIVKWHVEGFALICVVDNGVEGFDYTDEATLVNNNFKVIGNIHDNPELIKK